MICGQSISLTAAHSLHNRHTWTTPFSRPDPTIGRPRLGRIGRFADRSRATRPIHDSEPAVAAFDGTSHPWARNRPRGYPSQEFDPMTFSITSRPRALIAAAVFMLGWVATQASAGLPDLPPFLPPPVGIEPQPPIVIAPPPPIHTGPPPVHNAPEPASLVIGTIGIGVAGFIARRRKRS
jgi:hypothetical protein